MRDAREDFREELRAERAMRAMARSARPNPPDPNQERCGGDGFILTPLPNPQGRGVYRRCPGCENCQPAPPPSAEETQRYIRICRNPHEPFYWDADKADDPCPSGECQGTEAEHETWVPEARAVQAERERDEARARIRELEGR